MNEKQHIIPMHLPPPDISIELDSSEPRSKFPIPFALEKTFENAEIFDSARIFELLEDREIDLLLVDCRHSDQFDSSRIAGSINPQFPSLMIKRFRKLIFSNFNLGNFLTADGQSKYHQWKSGSKPKYIVVYDELMEREVDCDTWVVLYAMLEGMGSEISPHSKPTIGWLSGGITAFRRYPKAKRFIAGNFEKTIEIAPPTANQIKVAAPIGKPGAPKKLGLTIKKVHSPEISVPILETPSSAASAKDIAAPALPYSKITDNIIVGSDMLPLSPEGPQLMSEIGVTHILNMAAEIPNSQIMIDCGKFSMLHIPVYDNTDVDMDEPLNDAINFIVNAIEKNPNAVVFVHCKAGRSRSVSVVIGYLVKMLKYTLTSAYAHVRSCRKGVSPNLGFMAALLKLEKETHGENSAISDLYA